MEGNIKNYNSVFLIGRDILKIFKLYSKFVWSYYLYFKVKDKIGGYIR